MGNECKILVVDDFAMVRSMVKSALNQAGYEDVDQARNGEHALEKLKQADSQGQPFKIAFLDWNMPVMSGLELVKACREDDSLRNILIVMVTVESEQKNVIKALKAGVDDYIVKPFTPHQIQQKLSKLVPDLAKSA